MSNSHSNWPPRRHCVLLEYFRFFFFFLKKCKLKRRREKKTSFESQNVAWSPQGLFITPMFPPQTHWDCERGHSQETTGISSHESDTCCSRAACGEMQKHECKTWMVRVLSRFLYPPLRHHDKNLIMIWKRQLRTGGQSDLTFEWFGSLWDTSTESCYIWTDIIELALLCIILHQTSSICVFNYGCKAPTTDIPGGIHWKHPPTYTHPPTHSPQRINWWKNAHLWSLNYIWPIKHSIKNINIKIHWTLK